MKRLGTMISLMAAACWFGANPALAASPAATKVEKAILDLETQRFKVMMEGDIKTLDSLLAPDLSYSHSSGWTQTKDEFIESIRTRELEYKEIKPDAMQVRVYGSTAVVTGRAQVRAKTKGQENAFELRFLDVYVKRKGKWQMVAWQSARLAK